MQSACNKLCWIEGHYTNIGIWSFYKSMSEFDRSNFASYTYVACNLIWIINTIQDSKYIKSVWQHIEQRLFKISWCIIKCFLSDKHQNWKLVFSFKTIFSTNIFCLISGSILNPLSTFSNMDGKFIIQTLFIFLFMLEEENKYEYS